MPFLSTATDHTKVEGVVSTSFSPGPSRRLPSLAMATPCGVPFSKSSKCDCVHRWCPVRGTQTEVRRKAQRQAVRRDKPKGKAKRRMKAPCCC